MALYRNTDERVANILEALRKNNVVVADWPTHENLTPREIACYYAGRTEGLAATSSIVTNELLPEKFGPVPGSGPGFEQEHWNKPETNRPKSIEDFPYSV